MRPFGSLSIFDRIVSSFRLRPNRRHRERRRTKFLRSQPPHFAKQVHFGLADFRHLEFGRELEPDSSRKKAQEKWQVKWSRRITYEHFRNSARQLAGP